MKLKYNLAILFLFTFVGFSFTSTYEEVPTERTKSITKTFPISADGTTSLSNKYGKMDINVWDKNEVQITVNVKVDARNDRKEQEILDGIDVEFDNSSDYVSATTEFDLKGSYNNVSYNVEYEVKMEGWGSDPTRCCDIDILHTISADARTFRIYYRQSRIIPTRGISSYGSKKSSG